MNTSTYAYTPDEVQLVIRNWKQEVKKLAELTSRGEARRIHEQCIQQRMRGYLDLLAKIL